jgi:hypothetical protein
MFSRQALDQSEQRCGELESLLQSAGEARHLVLSHQESAHRFMMRHAAEFIDQISRRVALDYENVEARGEAMVALAKGLAEQQHQRMEADIRELSRSVCLQSRLRACR